MHIATSTGSSQENTT